LGSAQIDTCARGVSARPRIFRPRTGLAGEVLQKVANDRLKPAVVGDVSTHVAAGTTFRDLVRGIDCGDSILIVSDLVALADRVAALNS
jgi:Domain of unknown function (DUF4180)